ncbi:MAG: NnrS family protein [Gammaproteobacteria bacterium]|nr:NnrS family protein [Gammaproteobacteria bacterium]
MLKIHSEPDKKSPLSSDGPAVFALGFRPLFSAAGISAVVLMLAWIPIWMGVFTLPGYYGPVIWHSHEMLFGYAAAIIAGFLLTAVRNWTGVNTPHGGPLALLTALWLAGRLAPLSANWLPDWLVAMADLAFLPTVALAIQPALWQGEQKINRIFVPILLTMALANLLVHLQALGYTATAMLGIDTMLYLVAFLVSLLAGRVMPFFTQAMVPGYQATRRSWLEQATLGGFALLLLLHLLSAPGALLAVAALLLAVTQALRVAGWHHPNVWRIPILWVLYSGMFWMVAGFTLLALASLGLVAANLAKHAIAVGAVGVLTLGMMARVSLGHTGRPIEPKRSIEAAFLLLNLAAFARVFGPLLPVGSYTFWVHLSGGIWILCFVLFCLVYLPILGRTRVDGRPG